MSTEHWLAPAPAVLTPIVWPYAPGLVKIFYPDGRMVIAEALDQDGSPSTVGSEMPPVKYSPTQPANGSEPGDPSQKYSPSQPRRPAGSPQGGEWTDGGGGASGAPSSGPPSKPWQDPPPPQGKAGGSAGGFSATGKTNTEIGDLAERLVVDQLGARSLLPFGKRQNPLDLAIGGWAFELKCLTTEAAEYKIKMKSSELKSKVKYARRHKLKPAMMMAVMDLKSKSMQVYWREGLGNFRLTKDKWHFLGKARITGVKMAPGSHWIWLPEFEAEMEFTGADFVKYSPNQPRDGQGHWD